MFYKTRYLRSGGRFRGVWLAAHFIPLDTNEDLMDICADLAQLLNPTRRALMQQQVPSLRLASLLTAGTVRRYAQLCDNLLQDITQLLYNMHSGFYSGRQPDGRENESTNTDTPVNSSEEERRNQVTSEALQRTTVNATEMLSDNDIERDEFGNGESGNMNEENREHDDENEYETLLDDQDTNVTGSTSNNEMENSDDLSSVQKRIENSGSPVFSNTSMSPSIVTAKEFTPCQDKMSGPLTWTQGIDSASGYDASRTTFYLTSSATAQLTERGERSPIIYTSADRRLQFANFATSTKSNEVSPIISTGITATIPIASTALAVSTTSTYDARDRSSVIGGPQLSPILSTSHSRRRLHFSSTRSDDRQCSAAKKMRMSDERNSEIGTPSQVRMNSLRCPIKVPMGSQEVQITQHGEESINFSEEFHYFEGGMQIDSEVPGENSPLSMTPSNSSQAPTESSRRTPQISPPCTPARSRSRSLPHQRRSISRIQSQENQSCTDAIEYQEIRRSPNIEPHLDNWDTSLSRTLQRQDTLRRDTGTPPPSQLDIASPSNSTREFENEELRIKKSFERTVVTFRAGSDTSNRSTIHRMTTTTQDSPSSSPFEHRILVTSADIHEAPNGQELLSPASAFRSYFRTSYASSLGITATPPHLSYIDTSPPISLNHRYIGMCTDIRYEPKEWPILTPPPAFRSDFQTPSPPLVLENVASEKSPNKVSSVEPSTRSCIIDLSHSDDSVDPDSTTTDEEPSCEGISRMEIEENDANNSSFNNNICEIQKDYQSRIGENRDIDNLGTIEEVSEPNESENNNKETSHVFEGSIGMQQKGGTYDDEHQEGIKARVLESRGMETLETNGGVSEYNESEKDHDESLSSEENNENHEEDGSYEVQEQEAPFARILNNILKIPETIEEVSEPNESHNQEEIIETDHDEISNAQDENNDEEYFDMEESSSHVHEREEEMDIDQLNSDDENTHTNITQYVDVENVNTTSAENEMVEPVQVNLDPQSNLEENSMESQDSPDSYDSTSSQSSLGLDSISFIYQRNTVFDPSRTLVIVKNKVSENYELNETIKKEWRNKFL